MFVKLCGLRSLDDAQAAIEAKADALGFILAESKRQVTPEFVASLRDDIPMPPTIVGVTVDRSAGEIDHLYEAARLDMVQLSGDEPVSILDELELPLIKAVRIPAGTHRDDAVAAVDQWFVHRRAPEIVIVEGGAGGSGTLADWKLMREITVRYPVVLAGGLTPENVAEAIRSVQPIGVDTSSGTETDGVKDPAKLTAFVENARQAFLDL